MAILNTILMRGTMFLFNNITSLDDRTDVEYHRGQIPSSI